MPNAKNLVHETSTTTGAGNFTLEAVNGRVRFSNSTYGFSTGSTQNVFDYFITNRAAAEWERGTGHMSDAETLVRDTVIESSNGNAAVVFTAGTKDVTNDIPAGTFNAGVVNTFNGRTGAVSPASGDYTASQITNVAAGSIAATTVQNAINELDTEKASIAYVSEAIADAFAIVTPEEFGAVGDGQSDDAQAFSDMADYVVANLPDGAIINFAEGANYRIWASSPVTSGATLMKFSGVQNLTINGRGARIFTDAAAFSGSAFIAYFDGTTDANSRVTINGLWYEQTVYNNITEGYTAGAHVIYVMDDFTGLTVRNLRVVSALGGVNVARTAADTLASEIDIAGGYLEKVYYPLGLQANGFNTRWSDGKFKNVGRTLVCYNVSNVTFEYIEEYVPNIAPSIAIVCYGYASKSARYNTTSNVKVRGHIFTDSTISSAAIAGIIADVVVSDEAPVTFNNIDIKIDAYLADITNSANLFTFGKANSDATTDTVARGHTFNNVFIGGAIRSNGGAVFQSLYGPVSSQYWYAYGTASTISAQTNEFTGSISGTTLTVTAVASGTIYVGSKISSGSVTTGTEILEQLTGTTGSTGTYRVSRSQTASSGTIYGTYGLLTFGGTTSGTPSVGCYVTGASGVVPGTRITAAAGGNWVVDNNTAVSSTTIYAGAMFNNVGLRDFSALGAIQGAGLESITFDMTGQAGALVIDNVTVDLPTSITGAISGSSLHVNNYKYLGSEAETTLNDTVLLSAAQTLTNKTLTSPTLTTPALGTPASGTLTNCTGLPVSTGISGLGTGVATFLATPSSANLASAVTGETGSGALVFGTGPSLDSPVLTTPALGTPASGTLTNCTGLPASTGVTGLGTAATQNTGTSGATIPFLNGTNTWANAQTYSAQVLGNAGAKFTNGLFYLGPFAAAQTVSLFRLADTATDFTIQDSSGNNKFWFECTNGTLGIAAGAASTAYLGLPGGTTSRASINIASGSAPSSPVDGDIWFDGTNLKIRVSGATYTLTKT